VKSFLTEGVKSSHSARVHAKIETAAPGPRELRPGMTRATLLQLWSSLVPQLRAELVSRFGSIRKAVLHAGLNYQHVMQWLSLRHVPEAEGLRRLLEACSIPLGPYKTLLEPVWVTLVCPAAGCGHRRQVRRSDLRKIQRKAKGRGPLVQRADGVYEVPCSRHTPGHLTSGRWPNGSEQRLRDVFGKDVKNAARAARILTELKKHTPNPGAWSVMTLVQQACLLGTDARDELAAELRKPRPDLGAAFSRLRASQVARGRTLNAQRPRRSPSDPPKPTPESIFARFLRGPVNLCPLCELAIYRRTWHRACQLTWLGRAGEFPAAIHAANLPPATRTRGPSPKGDFRRNLRWLLEQRAHRRSRQILARQWETTVTAVRKGALAALRLMPGSWDVFYARGTDNQGNRTRQQYLLDLPGDGEFQSMIARDGRDPLIRRLHGFGMSIEDIVTITGASSARIRHVVAGSTAPITA
jgi:hypothetical protein